MPVANLTQDQLVSALRAMVRDEVRGAMEDSVHSNSVREVLRREMEQFVGGELFRKVLRDEVATPLAARNIAVQRGRGNGVLRGGLPGKEEAAPNVDELQAGGSSAPKDNDGVNDFARRGSMSSEASADILVANSESHVVATLIGSAKNNMTSPIILTGSKMSRLGRQWLSMWERRREPPREGMLANFSGSKLFASLMHSVIMADVLFMIYTANLDIVETSSTQTCTYCIAMDWVFQSIYTMEFLLGLAVHRLWFFCNAEYRQNWFNCVLVIEGFVALLFKSYEATAVRLLRLARLTKVFRAVRALTSLRELHIFLICLRGSYMPFFWALALLAIILMIFSLVLVQIVSAYLDQEGLELTGNMRLMFGSVRNSMMTLFKASTGGDDWGNAYDVISETGLSGKWAFLIFITFVQLAMVNIITGIYVDAAMSAIRRDAEATAASQAQYEKECALQLEYLCRMADPSDSGKVAKDFLEDPMLKHRITTLLALLGMRQEHVLRIFNQMSALSKEEDGRVDIGDFVAGCMSMKGQATHFDMQVILEEIRRTFRNQLEIWAMLGAPPPIEDSKP